MTVLALAPYVNATNLATTAPALLLSYNPTSIMVGDLVYVVLRLYSLNQIPAYAAANVALLVKGEYVCTAGY
jgi:hypothetical protein